MVALARSLVVPLPPRVKRTHRLDVVASKTFLYPRLSLWRKDPIKTELEWRNNDKLYCLRFHPHRHCTGRLMLTGEQVEVLLEYWHDAPLHHCWLPQAGSTQLLAQRLPDGGLQFSRIDRCGQVGITFRVFAQDVATFLGFAERWLPRL